ncbi:MAG: flagellar hook-basal body complex protein FliE [Pirellulaceae bacterium]
MIPISPSLPIGTSGSIQSLTSSAPASTGNANKLAGSDNFGDLLQNFVKSTNQDQNAADSIIEAFATGKTDNIQQVVLAMTNADLSFKFFMEIRNKVIDSYNELMRMQF